MEFNKLLDIAKDKDKALALGGAGKINGQELVFIEYDGITEDQVDALGFELQDEFDLNQFAKFKTKNGFHIKYYFDPMPHEKVIRILEASRTNSEYLSIAKEHYCINRVTGKHKHKDIIFLGLQGHLKNPDSPEVIRGKSLLKLHLKMQQISIKGDFLL